MLDLLIFNAVLGLVAAAIANRKGQPFVTWFLYGLLIWPVAIIHALVVRPGAPPAVTLWRRTPPEAVYAPPVPQRAQPVYSTWAAPSSAPPVTRDELRHWFGPR
jgi:uncharacterized membrane protein YedE/YeeE